MLLRLQLLDEVKALPDLIRLKFEKVKSATELVGVRFAREIDKFCKRSPNLQGESVPAVVAILKRNGLRQERHG